MATEGSENSIIFKRGEHRERRVYKYMHIYLWSILCFEIKIARIYPVGYLVRLSDRVNTDLLAIGFTNLTSGTTAVDSQMTTSFLMLQSENATYMQPVCRIVQN